jgi:type IV pilus assembly protein PilB
MSEVDATRTLAREHDLEFVELDGYGVDPETATVLSERIARRHHVVAVNRKFGIPVIAVANPDDIFAMDTIRASMGRDFTLVVAGRDQIVRYIDRLYGGEVASGPTVSDTTGAPSTPLPPLVTPSQDTVKVGGGDTPEVSLNGLTFEKNGTFIDEGPLLNGHSVHLPGNEIDSDLVADPDALAASASELARLASSMPPPEPVDKVDSAAEIADLVDEAVATFEGQQTEPELLPGTTPTFPPLARTLIEGNRVSLADMEVVLEEHDRSGRSIARILTAKKLVTEADLMWGMAHEMGLEFVDLDLVGVNFNESELIPEATARHHNVLLIANDLKGPVVAASNPTDVFAMDDLRTIMGQNFTIVVATRSQINAQIGRAYGRGDAAEVAETASLEFDRDESGSNMEDIQAITEEAPIVRYVNLLMVQALNERASDIHVEPTATNLRIRLRIDGVLHDVSTAPRSIAAAVTTRLKVMADMNIAEHRIPQDGRISVIIGHKEIDLRMATLPTIHGEKIVMRVLDKSSVVLGFPDLGFDDDLLSTYEGIYTKPYGTILVTGPTGSGKSTTLYATLVALNSPEKNIITVEDPVELQLSGVNQVQLNVKAGLTFASALKSILRADPDIVLVGEIRDRETAVIAVEASLTGHLVLATLHTNSAAATPMRLVEMGLEPFMVTSSLTGVLAQRLTRRLCDHCKEGYDVSEAEIVAAGWTVEEMQAIEETEGTPHFYRAKGCSACSNTGYRGRKALAELMPMTEEIERLIIEGGSVDDIHRMAVSQGMVTLRQSGLRKAIEGETTLEEVLRVVA